MTLRQINLRPSYDSDRDDPLREFYLPALSNAYRYDRLAGFFSSTSLAVAAKGIAPFIRNGGEIRLVCGAQLSEADVAALTADASNLDDVLGAALARSLDDLQDAFLRDHVAALGWLAREGRLEIKVAVPIDERGRPITADRALTAGYFHMKVGILHDRDGNGLSFSGSCNETASGWTRHVEEFKVFRQWETPERPFFDSDYERFRRFWNGEGVRRTLVVPIPEATRRLLISRSPDTASSLAIDRWASATAPGHAPPRKIVIRDYQRQAIDAWVRNGRKGIFEMATGTGKTIAALQCLSESLPECDRLITVICAPTIHLVEQWRNEVERMQLDVAIVVANSSNHRWREDVAHAILDVDLGERRHAVILTTHDSLAHEALTSRLERTKSRRMVIVDEVHGVGAPTRAQGLLDLYTWRLGLSATPRRWMDDSGTAALDDYFGGVVFEFGLAKAIGTVNPDNGLSYLTPYRYFPVLVEMTDAEREEYERLTQSIVRNYRAARSSQERQDLLTQLMMKRQAIVVNAANKFPALERLIEGLRALEYALFYCSPQQLERTQDLLNRRGIIQHKFTFREGTKPDDDWGGKSEREHILDQFAQREYQALVAINCLDEGVDVPATRLAVFMASTGNPRQFIQRRGRILRRYPGKEYAIVYDFIVLPSNPARLGVDFLSLEKSIFEKELARYEEFAGLALNSADADKVIEQARQRYGV